MLLDTVCVLLYVHIYFSLMYDSLISRPSPTSMKVPVHKQLFSSLLISTVVQVVHHLDTDGATGYKNITQFVSEACRVLKPGGALIINTTLPEQFEKGVVWFTTLIPEAKKKFQSRYCQDHGH